MRKRRRTRLRGENEALPDQALSNGSGPKRRLVVDAADRPYLFGAGFDGISQF